MEKRLPALILLFLANSALAFLPVPTQYRTITLSNGNNIEVKTAGNVTQHWVITKNTNIPLLLHRGIWYVGKYDEQGKLHRTEETFVAGAVPEPIVEIPQTTSGFNPFAAAAAASASASFHSPYRYDLSKGSFTQRLVIIRVAFSDIGFQYSDAQIAAKIFGESNSVKHYFLKNSRNRFTLAPVTEYQGSTNDGIIRVTLNEAHPNFGTNFYPASRDLLTKVLSKAASMLNWKSYDRNGDNWIDASELGIVLVVAGYENALGGSTAPSPKIWAHKANYVGGQVGGVNFGSYAMFGERHNDHLATIGIIAHELGHLLFNLPDMYGNGFGIGVGNWGLMGTGAWNGSGNAPANMLAWSKQLSRFDSLNKAAVGSHKLTLSSQSDDANLLEIPLDTYRHGERLLIEYRRKVGYDQGLPGEGVLVTQVNDWSNYGSYHSQSPNYPIAVEEADGRQDLAFNRNRGQQGDLYTNASASVTFAPKQSNTYNSAQRVTLKTTELYSSQADVSFTLSGTILGDNIGLDEVAPNATIGSSTMDTVMRLVMPDNVIQIDGLDLFSMGSGQATVSVYTTFDGTSEFGPLSTQSPNTSISKGWNRIMFPALKASANETFYVRIQTSMQSGAPLAIDLRGQASGRTWYRSSNHYIYNQAGFDASAKLLYRAEGSALSALKTPVRSYKKKKSGGGAIIYLLLLCLIPMAYRFTLPAYSTNYWLKK